MSEEYTTITRGGKIIKVRVGSTVMAIDSFWEKEVLSKIKMNWGGLVALRGGDISLPMVVSNGSAGGGVIELMQGDSVCIRLSRGCEEWRYFVLPCDVKEFPDRIKTKPPVRSWS